LRIRRPDNHTSESLVLTYKLATRQQLTPDAVETESTIEFDSLQHEVRELECESDPIIRIVDVHAGELEGWDLIPTGPNTPAHVRVRFREPVRKGTLRIYGICPLNGRNAEIWTSPELRLLNAIPREENLVLHVHSDVQFTDWRPGRYRQVKTVVEG